MATLPDTVQTAFDRAAAQRALVLPTIPEELRALEADELLDGATEPLEAIDARDLIIADGNFSELEASHARFTNCFLSCCDFSGALFTAGQPDPDLIIRPSGEERLSNFLLWQSAYAEFVSFDILWPDFKPKHLDAAIEKFQSRSRRFGGV